MDVSEEVGNDADVGSWGQRRSFRGRGAASGRCLRILTAGAERRTDHTADSHQYRPLVRNQRHANGDVFGYDRHD
ncbi:MAG: hypothetical protein ACYDDU_16525, partial [Dermatophilaceae bacterium]